MAILTFGLKFPSFDFAIFDSKQTREKVFYEEINRAFFASACKKILASPSLTVGSLAFKGLNHVIYRVSPKVSPSRIATIASFSWAVATNNNTL